MTQRNTFARKIGYLVAMAILLVPLFWLSNPATNAVKGSKSSPGGQLAQLRAANHLTQAELGQIDPTSATIKLATLGLRGIAANVLWEKAMDYQMKKDWTNMGATLNQIIKVQPNFISVWRYQGWNLAFNVSVAFDDYRERYRWVIKGVNFLKEGESYNENQPCLVWDVGKTVQWKIGRSDEVKQFRKLFKADDDFHGSRAIGLRDSWLVAKEQYDEAVKMTETGRGVLFQKPLAYLAGSPLCQMYYGIALEREGTFGEVAQRAWGDAADDWRRYGLRDILIACRAGNQLEVIHLEEKEKCEDMARELRDQVDALQPGLREKNIAEKRALLPSEQREALDTPAEKRTEAQKALIRDAEQAIQVTYEEVARQMKEPQRTKAVQMAKEALAYDEKGRDIFLSRQTSNYTFWKQRAQVEQLDDSINARRLLHQGDEALLNGDLIVARDSYQEGFAVFRKVIDANKSLLQEENENFTEELVNVIKRYNRILGQLDEAFPEKFILQDVISTYEGSHGKVDFSSGAKGAAKTGT